MQLLVAFSALRTAALLPALDLLYINVKPVSSVGKFCAARQLSGHPVTLVDTRKEFFEQRKLYAWLVIVPQSVVGTQSLLLIHNQSGIAYVRNMSIVIFDCPNQTGLIIFFS